jgi:large subunit ribosomal protein L16
VLFEIGGVTEEVAKEAMRLAGHKLPIPTKFAQKTAESAPAESTDAPANELATV